MSIFQLRLRSYYASGALRFVVMMFVAQRHP